MATRGSGIVFPNMVAPGEPHPITPPSALHRFSRGVVGSAPGAAGVAI
jgi:hypothetical protein